MIDTGTSMTSGRVASRDGTPIGYLKTGRGPAVVIMHGSMESARSHTLLAQSCAAPEHGLKIALFWWTPALALSLTYAWIVQRHGRDVIALESTAKGFDLYLCDSPNGAADYSVTIAIPASH